MFAWQFSCLQEKILFYSLQSYASIKFSYGSGKLNLYGSGFGGGGFGSVSYTSFENDQRLELAFNKNLFHSILED
jgi:hypothetical protein